MEEKSGELDQLLLSVADLKQLVENLGREVQQLEFRYQTSGIDIYQLSPQFHTREEEQDFERYRDLSDEGFIPNNFTKLLSDLEKIEAFIKEHQVLLAEPV
jgi:hypothetical protein